MNEIILLFNITAERKKKIIKAALPLHIRIKTVERCDYNKPLESLLSAKNNVEAEQYNGEELEGEMMILYGFSSLRMDLLFNAMKKSGAGIISHTAVVTDTNKTWNASQLFAELKKERETMQEMNAQK